MMENTLVKRVLDYVEYSQKPDWLSFVSVGKLNTTDTLN